MEEVKSVPDRPANPSECTSALIEHGVISSVGNIFASTPTAKFVGCARLAIQAGTLKLCVAVDAKESSHTVGGIAVRYKTVVLDTEFGLNTALTFEERGQALGVQLAPLCKGCTFGVKTTT